METNRRAFLKILGGLGASALASRPLFRVLADSPAGAKDEFFIFIHASGGWDVTLWSDPRNSLQGLIQPATTDVVDKTGVDLWTPKMLDDGSETFETITPPGSALTFGPGIGQLSQLYSRLCLINGISMNTVSHPDGTIYSVTGRHLSGGRAVASSIDTMVANELGKEQLFPLISVQYPSSLVNSAGPIDARATPLRIAASMLSGDEPTISVIL